MSDYDEDEDCDNKTDRKPKQPTRDDLWNLRYKYYAIYQSLIEKLPPDGRATGSFDYLKTLHRIDAEAGIYSKVLEDIDKLLGV